jgi:hypothetical protein
MIGLSAAQVLDTYFLEIRSKLLDLAAALDRIDRGGGAPQDRRCRQIEEALAILADRKSDRAERVQQAFSLPYEPDWDQPRPR